MSPLVQPTTTRRRGANAAAGGPDDKHTERKRQSSGAHSRLTADLLKAESLDGSAVRGLLATPEPAAAS